METDSPFEANRRNWDERASIHARSKMYDLEAVRQGKNSLLPLEREILGDVRGKKILHLQCHIGTDSVSWARLGAQVTGLDLSGESLNIARQLARDCGVEIEFIQANVYDAPDSLNGTFDIVIATYGVLCWLPDMAGFARVAARCLRPGGAFLLIDDHPARVMLNMEAGGTLRVTRSYFYADAAEYNPPGWTYSDADGPLTCPYYEWTHHLGEIVSGVAAAGLRIESLGEYPFCFWKSMEPGMTQDAAGWWRLAEEKVPLMFSLCAVKPE